MPKRLPTGSVLIAMLFSLSAGSVRADSKTAPYYATPSWDQQMMASERFVVLPNWVDDNFPLGGAAVLDRETGLVWERSPSTLADLWENAQSRCDDLRVGNRKGWHLPTLQELASLVDPTVAIPGPTLPAGHPFVNVQTSSPYWSATTYRSMDSGFARLVSFVDGFSRGFDYKFPSTAFVWCVRGGQGVDPQ